MQKNFLPGKDVADTMEILNAAADQAAKLLTGDAETALVGSLFAGGSPGSEREASRNENIVVCVAQAIVKELQDQVVDLQKELKSEREARKRAESRASHSEKESAGPFHFHHSCAKRI